MTIVISVIGAIVISTAVSTSLMALWSLTPRLPRLLRAMR